MHSIGRLCTSQNAVAFRPVSDDHLTILPRTSSALGHRGCSTLQPLPLSMSWNSSIEIDEKAQWKLHTCFASTQSPKRPQAGSERSFWPPLLSRPLIYSSNFSDVDPMQLSELWLQTLRVRRDPVKIIKSLRHSFTFVVVLAEDESAYSTTGYRLKTVGIGRAVSDGSFIATICDVAVDPAYRHRGIGRRIVKKLVENVKKIGGPTGFAVFPPPLARRFFWMIGFRSDRKYKLMVYRKNLSKGTTETDGVISSEDSENVVNIE